MKIALQIIKKLIGVFCGMLGGIVIGIILSLILLHLKKHSVDLPSLKVLIPITLVSSIAAGIIAPRFFMMYALCPISWMTDSDTSGGGHPSGDFDVTLPDFLLNISYMLGLLLLGFGVLFSLPWIVGTGLLGIVIFSIGIFKLEHKPKANR